AAQRRAGPAALHRRGVRAGLLDAAEPGGEAGRGLWLRLSACLRHAAVADAHGVLVAVPTPQRLSPRLAPGSGRVGESGDAAGWQPQGPRQGRSAARPRRWGRNHREKQAMHSTMRVIAAAAVIVGAGLFVAGDADARRGAKATEAPAWMNAEGEVTDSAAVEAGYGETVKGLNDWEGEITGKPAPGSKFTQLHIGMRMKQVTDLIGDPTEQ